MQRFFLPNAPLAAGSTADLSPLRHQLRRVLRARAGDHIVLLDGCGSEYETELQTIDDGQATGRVLEKRSASGEPRAQVSLFQCALKADKMEWVLQKGTELGVSRFVPVISERTIVRPASALLGKYERWRSILREAAEQSGRGRLPELMPPLLWNDAIHQANGIRILPWEEAAGAVGLVGRFLHESGRPEGHPRISLLVGPEGGITAGEAQAATGVGWELVTLGPRTLRAETAALTALAIVMALMGEMGRHGPTDVCGPTAVSS